MSRFHELDRILLNQRSGQAVLNLENIIGYARGIAEIENSIVIVSDLHNRCNRTFSGRFSDTLGIDCHESEDTIWESSILSLMPDEDREEKFLAELRFLHYLRRLPKRQRRNYYLATRLKFNLKSGKTTDVLHRMFYIHNAENDSIRFSICIYEPLVSEMAFRSMVVNTVTGIKEKLTSTADNNILSKREKQILVLINEGKTSNDIAAALCISKHTVSRHRQEILAKLQVKNSLEACRRAKTLSLI